MCFDCIYFRTLYRRTKCQFFVYHSGDCFKHGKMVEKEDVCPQWEERPADNRISPDVLKRALIDLDTIKNILTEENERIEKG